MEMNPVMERIIRLSEQWESALLDNPEAKVFCWRGNSMSEYKMIRGFILFHMSEDSTLEDIFIACHQPFDSLSAEVYGKNALDLMDTYVRSWNKDEKLAAKTGAINWSPVYETTGSDAANFVSNMNRLAQALSCNKEEKKLVVCILPQRLEDLNGFRLWVTELLKSPVDPSVCYMLYDAYESRLFDKTAKDFLQSFKYLVPDMDLYGAANQILEDKKQEKTDAESKDIISYQQLLLKLTEATGKGDEKKAEEYAQTAIGTIKDYGMPHMEALIYYLLYSMYVSINGSKEKTGEAIDKSIILSKKAVEKNIPGSRITCCQYLITKGNTYFFDKKYEKALQLYSEALEISERDCVAELRISIYQMIGTCRRIAGDFDAWDAFVKGWEIAEKLEEQQIKTQIPLLYFASEMLKTGNSKERYEYEKRFASLWGENWREDLARQEKENKQRISQVSTQVAIV